MVVTFRTIQGAAIVILDDMQASDCDVVGSLS